MKKIFFITSLILGSLGFAHAQTDYCKEIIKKVDEMKGKTTFVTPSISKLVDMRIEKSFGFKPHFSILFSLTKENPAYDYKAIYVKFDDGTILTYVDDIDCSYLNSQDHYLFLGIKL